jgi:hypothetical protein
LKKASGYKSGYSFERILAFLTGYTILPLLTMDKLNSSGKPTKETVTEIKIDEKSIFAPLYNEVEKVEIIYCEPKSKGFRRVYEILSFNACPDPESFRHKIKELYKTFYAKLSEFIQKEPISERSIILNNCEVQLRELKAKVLGTKYDFERNEWPNRFVNCECILASKIEGKIVRDIIEELPPGPHHMHILHQHARKVSDRNNMKNNTGLLKTAEPFVFVWLESVDKMIVKLENLLENPPKDRSTPKKININEKLLPTLTKFLMQYFRDNTYSELYSVLSGSEIKEKLIFYSTAARFLDVFYLLYAKSDDKLKLIEDKKTVTIQWIIDNFKYIKKNTPNVFEPTNMNNYINVDERKCRRPLSPDFEDDLSDFLADSEHN